MPVGLLRVIDTKLASTENVLLTTDKIRIVVHRKNLQDYTAFHFAGSHNDNEVWKHQLQCA